METEPSQYAQPSGLSTAPCHCRMPETRKAIRPAATGQYCHERGATRTKGLSADRSMLGRIAYAIANSAYPLHNNFFYTYPRRVAPTAIGAILDIATH